MLLKGNELARMRQKFTIVLPLNNQPGLQTRNCERKQCKKNHKEDHTCGLTRNIILTWLQPGDRRFAYRLEPFQRFSLVYDEQISSSRIHLKPLKTVLLLSAICSPG